MAGRSIKSLIGGLAVVGLVVLSCGALAQTGLEGALRGTWTVTVERDARTRILIISDVPSQTTGAFSAVYGFGDNIKEQAEIQATLELIAERRQMRLMTQAGSVIVAVEGPDGIFKGTFTSRRGQVSGVTISRATAEELAANKRGFTDLVPLAPDVPKECSAFHGAWAGTWVKGGGLKISLNVPEVTADAKGGCVLRLGMRGSTEPAPAGKLVNVTPGDRPSFPCGSGQTCSFHLVSGDIWLSISGTSSQDDNNRAVLHKVSH